MAKKRLDELMFERGMTPSRERAKTTIMSCIVYVGDQKADKPGMQVPPDAEIEVRGEALRYVSRGGLKLEKALKVFPVGPEGRVCIDCGASTGGFTDCLLQNGAKKVYAVDVGYGQLAWQLRNDGRVVCMERTNIRYVTPEQIGEPCSLAVMDLSFISLKLVLPPVFSLLEPDGEVICLVKPQFEAGRGKVGKKGVVRDSAVHVEVLENFLQYAADAGYTVMGLDYSPIRGPEGNIEYIAWLKKGRLDAGPELRPDEIVAASHAEFDK